MYFIIDKLIGLRIDSIGEQRGLDFSEHYEIAYPEFQKEILHEGKS
jgi:Amt family ammonium transporter